MDQCYICFEEDDLCSHFCACSMYVHAKCLKTLIETNKNAICRVCKSEYKNVAIVKTNHCHFEHKYLMNSSITILIVGIVFAAFLISEWYLITNQCKLLGCILIGLASCCFGFNTILCILKYTQISNLCRIYTKCTVTVSDESILRV